MEFDITFTGVAPLMQNRYNLQTGEKKDKPKTAEAFQAMLQKQWADALYLDDEGFVCVPSEALQACIRDGAKKNRKGKDIQAGIWVTPFKPRLEIKTNGKYRCVTRDDIAGDEQFIDVRGVKVGQARVDRCRPVFSPPWRVRFRLHCTPPSMSSARKASEQQSTTLVAWLGYLTTVQCMDGSWRRWRRRYSSVFCRRWARHGEARQGMARPGEAGQGKETLSIGDIYVSKYTHIQGRLAARKGVSSPPDPTGRHGHA